MRTRSVAVAVLLYLGAVPAAVQVFAQAVPQTVSGYLVDVMCSTKHASEGAAFGATHDKSCLLMEACVKSGYSIMTTDNRVLKFDPKGNETALALINRTNREGNWRINVTGTVTNDTIAVTNIVLQ
jgi:hypothetical protein